MLALKRYMFHALALLLSALFGDLNVIAAGENSETDFGTDTPQLHIIAVDKDGDLNYPEITKDGKPITSWSPDAYDVHLRKFSSSLDLSTCDDTSKSASQHTAHDPTKWGGDYLQAMMDAIKRRRGSAEHPLQIVIHIHGGMNSITGAVQAAAHGYWVMEKQDKTIYPIFVCWNSEPLSCYWDHLAFDRSGYSLRGSNWEAVGYLTSPFYLFGDIGAGAARGPSIAIEQGINDFKTVSPQLYPENMNYVPMFEERKSEILKYGREGTAIHVMEGADNFDDLDGAWNAIKYTFTLPLKMIAGGVINGLGPGAWAEMKRRVDLMFWKQEQFLNYYSDVPHPNTPERLVCIADKQRTRLGGLAWFLGQLKHQVLLNDEGTHIQTKSQDIRIQSAALKKAVDDMLEKKLSGHQIISGDVCLNAADYDDLKSSLANLCLQNSNLSGKGYEVSLIGHSMGAIVINEMLENDPDIPYKKIVYMAAACSVKDFQDTVIPYMESNPDCKFYNLCLNPNAELRNIELYEIAPRGGLLNWINDIFEGPPDIRHRMYGEFITSINTSDIIPKSICGRVYMKAFGFGTNPTPDKQDPHFQEGFPHNHGEFNSFGTSSQSVFTGGPPGHKLPVVCEGNRPKTANPHGFWTEDFLWYDKDANPDATVNPLTLQAPQDPNLQPGTPVYLDAFDKKWHDIDQHPAQLFPSTPVYRNTSGTKIH